MSKKAKKASVLTIFCPYCHKAAIWTENKTIYGRNYGKSYMCYICPPCGAYVGCHNNTRHPLGTLANKELREARILAHAVLDPIWKSGVMTRSEVYSKLKEVFGREVHIAQSDLDECREIITHLIEEKHLYYKVELKQIGGDTF